MIMKVFPEMTNFLLSVFHSGTPHRIVSKFTFFYHRIPENHHTFIIIIIIIIYIYIYIYKTETFAGTTIFHVSTILKK